MESVELWLLPMHFPGELIQLRKALHVHSNDLTFAEIERSSGDDTVRLFETVRESSEEEKGIAHAGLARQALRHSTRRWGASRAAASGEVESG